MDTISSFFVTFTGDSWDLCDSRALLLFLCSCRWQTASQSQRGYPSRCDTDEDEDENESSGATNEHACMMEHLNGSDDTWNCFACYSGQRHSSKAEEEREHPHPHLLETFITSFVSSISVRERERLECAYFKCVAISILSVASVGKCGCWRASALAKKNSQPKCQNKIN